MFSTAVSRGDTTHARPRPPDNATPAAVHVVRVDPQRLVHAPHPHLPPLRRRRRRRRLAREAVQCLPLVAKKSHLRNGRTPAGRAPPNKPAAASGPGGRWGWCGLRMARRYGFVSFNPRPSGKTGEKTTTTPAPTATARRARVGSLTFAMQSRSALKLLMLALFALAGALPGKTAGKAAGKGAGGPGGTKSPAASAVSIAPIAPFARLPWPCLT